jgi:hypothetical protein
MSTDARNAASPSANNPRLLRRLLGWLGRGVRTSRALQDVLGVELRTVQYYLQAAEWLGLVEGGPDNLLSPSGLEVAFGDDADEAYARAVYSQPLVADLLSGRPRLMPPIDDVVVAIARAEPDLAPATVRRRASAVRSLIAPALLTRRPRTDAVQLSLPLAPPAAGPPAHLVAGASRDADPDVYRFVYNALLDHGELRLGELRGLLDRAGVSELPIGGYVDLAVQRGDAARVEERLVVTAGAVTRRGVGATTSGVILSHPAYRQWLQDLHSAAAGDRTAEIRRDQVGPRMRAWDRRLLGGPATADTVDAALSRVLLDRSIDSFPIAGDPGPPFEPAEASYLDVWEQPGLVLTLPPTLGTLRGGLVAVNRALQDARQGITEVGLPNVATRPVLVHGALLHPGEPRPRSVPDLVSLRQRVLLNAPYPCLLATLLLLHREHPAGYAVRRVRGRWRLLREGRPLGPILDVIDGFIEQRGQLPCRRLTGGIPLDDLLAGLETVGVCNVLGEVVVLSERLFHRLRTDPEQMEIHALLRPLADALEAHVAELEPLEESSP